MDARYIANLKKALFDSSPKRKRNRLGVKARSQGKTKKALSSSKPSHVKRPSLRKADSLDNDIQSSMFRFLNEKMYKCSSSDASQYFAENPGAFELYHKGFQRQLQKWPNDPLQWPEQIIRKEFEKSPIVADLGCGDARLALHLKGLAKVHSFDLVAVNNRVTVCDMSKTPLPKESVDVAVFCLALMGTNCRDFIFEANRILKMNGLLLLVEVASRFNGPFKDFLKRLKAFGFKIAAWEITKDTYFARARLVKFKDLSYCPVSSLPNLQLSPCLYKKR
uniref:Ribosomal RNA-processing protein 8 n=1 Tax=Schistocephalus solidus TaxID=70667 RepID=A0A0X3PD13_SCHSO